MPRTAAPGMSGVQVSTPFVIIACTRSGGQVLVSGLDSHPEVYCERQESLGKRHPLTAYQGIPRTLAARLALTKRGYKRSGFKATTSQLLTVPGAGELLVELQPRVIWLERKDKVRRAISAALRGRPVDEAVHLDPDDVVHLYRTYAEQERAGLVWLDRSGLDWMCISYEEILDGRDEVDYFPRSIANKLADFLEVKHRRMEVTQERERGHSQPLGQLVANWGEVSAALEGEAGA